MEIHEIAALFGHSGSFAPSGNGHINDTYASDDGRYILQHINTSVFTDPDGLMENIVNVTEFLKKKISAAGGDPMRETLTVLPSLAGGNYVIAQDGRAYRMYTLIGDTKTVEMDNKTPEDMYQAGIGFGRFQKQLADYPAETLHETIPFFHDSVKRTETFKKAVSDDIKGRREEVTAEIEKALKWAGFAGTVVEGIADGSIPLAVTHNDTKINNILFDPHTNAPVCVLDLDTVMPGSRLYDYGDALRAGGTTADEDEMDLSKVKLDLDIFRRFTEGYLSEMADVLTEREIELLPFSVKLMAYECGIRFLGDYLNGDTYFKIARPKHNLDRARTQFKLVEEIEEKEELLKEIVREILAEQK